MKAKKASTLLVSAVLAAGIFGVSSAGVAQASAVSSFLGAPAGHWGRATPISLAGLGARDEAIQKMSCPSPGNCTAGGTYFDSAGNEKIFVVSEVNGGWGKAGLIPGLNALSKGFRISLDDISCASPGNCALGGGYEDASGEAQPFVADSANGRWGPAHTLVTLDDSTPQSIGQVTSVSCGRPGDCSAGVTLPEFVSTAGQPAVVIPVAFVAQETNGTWSAVQAVTVPAGTQAPSEVDSVSCWSPGNCVAGGFFSDADGARHAMTVSDDDGTWQTALAVPGFTSISDYNGGNTAVASVSCPGGDDCTLAGTYQDGALDNRPFVADVGAHGNFHPQAVPGSGNFDSDGNAAESFASCGAPGNCAFAGAVVDPTLSSIGLVDTEVAGNGVWGTAQALPGVGTGLSSRPESLSCGGPGSCVAGGFHTFDATNRERAFVAEESSRTWGAARRVAGNLDAGNTSATNAVSCASPGNCAAGGFYEDARGNQFPFVIDESSVTTTTLSLSIAKVKAGHEQSEHLTVQVKPRTSGTPAGQVTIKTGSTRLCVISLAKGNGTCALAASKLRPGTYHLAASYPGGTGYSRSTSAKKALTVTK